MAAWAVLRRLRTLAPWDDPPERYGPWKTVYDARAAAGAVRAPRS